MSDDIANRLRNKHADDLLAWEAADEIKRLRTERDEARREVCEWVALHSKKTTSAIAKDRNWDCYRCAFCGSNDELLRKADKRMCGPCQRQERED
jgi:hypothetical protein